MTISTLTTFFGWTLVINISFLLFSTLVLTLGRSFVLSVHSSILNMSEDELNRLYVNFLGNFKLGVFLLSLAPYLALKIMGG